MTWRLGVLLLALVPVVVWTHSGLDERLASRADDEILYLWSGDQVSTLFPGFEGLAADVYWLRTVQYFGGQKAFTEGRARLETHGWPVWSLVQVNSLANGEAQLAP